MPPVPSSRENGTAYHKMSMTTLVVLVYGLVKTKLHKQCDAKKHSIRSEICRSMNSISLTHTAFYDSEMLIYRLASHLLGYVHISGA